jgi:phage repressor protein C with HTH and peptisase S24 domain
MRRGHDTASILDRLLSVAGLKRDVQLAAVLGVSPQAVSQARKKDRAPKSWLIRMASRYHVSVDWLLYGENTTGSARSPAQPVSGLAVAGAVGERLDVVLVPLVAASLSAGSGSLESGGEVLDHFAFRQNWLARKGNPDNMVLMKVHGDSMEPDIRHGDTVLIDQGKTRLFGHAIYAVGVNEEIYVKQVETLPGNRLILRSLNERYAPIEVDLRGDMADSVRIIGKVLWWCREA